jgi:cell division protein ZipA
MSELRWTLLILGVVFIAALSWWERRRPRQAFAPRLRETGISSFGDPSPAPSESRIREAEAPHEAALPEGAASGAAHSREPWIGETGLADVVSADMTLSHAGDAGESAGDGPMHAHVEPARGPLDELPTLVIPDAEECRALEAAWVAQPPEPTLIEPGARTPSEAAEPELAVAAPAAEPEIRGAEGVGAVRIVEPVSCGDAAPPPEPIVDWPPEESRRILALRLIAPAERFSGRALRLALAAEGFLLGKFAIFHKPDEANRAVLCAASLTRPGAFDLETMDSQRYSGLSLFAVLPGPRTPQQAFEELLATARNLNERLEGALQDERGGPLTALRVAGIRDSLRAEAATLKAAATQ